MRAGVAVHFGTPAKSMYQYQQQQAARPPTRPPINVINIVSLKLRSTKPHRLQKRIA
jgi:hypothetical protein